MKLRLQSNSIRLRLKRSEVDHLAKTGSVEESIVFGGRPQDTFQYMLESSRTISTPEATLLKNGILVQVPAETILRWANGDDVGIEARLPAIDDRILHLIIEKDFACLNGSQEQNADTFPNPLEGTKC